MAPDGEMDGAAEEEAEQQSGGRIRKPAVKFDSDAVGGSSTWCSVSHELMGCHHNSLDAATTGSRGSSPIRDPEDQREEQMVIGATVELQDRAEVDASKECGGHYCWAVCARDKAGNESGWSGWSTFRVQ